MLYIQHYFGYKNILTTYPTTVFLFFDKQTRIYKRYQSKSWGCTPSTREAYEGCQNKNTTDILTFQTVFTSKTG